jgi:hypothetical protein
MTKKPSNIHWKLLGIGFVISVLALAVGFYALVQEKPKAEIYLAFDTGEENTFEVAEPLTVWLFETNFGLGSSPGRFKDDPDTIRLYGPDGTQIPFSDDTLGEQGGRGTFVLPKAGTYRLVADSVGEVESYGDLRGRRPYPLCRTVCDVAFFYALPTGAALFFIGLLLTLIRGVGKLFSGKEKNLTS